MLLKWKNGADLKFSEERLLSILGFEPWFATPKALGLPLRHTNGLMLWHFKYLNLFLARLVSSKKVTAKIGSRDQTMPVFCFGDTSSNPSWREKRKQYLYETLKKKYIRHHKKAQEVYGSDKI